MSVTLHSVDLSSVESLRAQMERMRAEFLRVHEQDCRTMRALEKRAKRAEGRADRLQLELDMQQARGEAKP